VASSIPLPIARPRPHVNPKAQPHQLALSPSRASTQDAPVRLRSPPTMYLRAYHVTSKCQGDPRSAAARGRSRALTAKGVRWSRAYPDASSESATALPATPQVAGRHRNLAAATEGTKQTSGNARPCQGYEECVARDILAASPTVSSMGHRKVDPTCCPRDPHAPVLFGLARDHSALILREANEAYDRPIPRFVEKDIRRCLACGNFSRGFVHLPYTSCACDVLVPFSCKTPALCPICAGRPMLAQAAHLVDAVVPAVPLRHHALPFPFELSRLAAANPKVLRVIAHINYELSARCFRRTAAESGTVCKTHVGSITHRLGPVSSGICICAFGVRRRVRRAR